MLSLDEIQELEFYHPKNGKKWSELINYLKERYLNNPTEKETILRYMYVLWILCLEAPILGYTDFLRDKNDSLSSEEYFDRSKYSKILSDIYFSSWKLFKNDPEYLFIVGYMIGFYVFDICKETDLIDHEKASNSMIKRAYELQPDNIVYELAYMGTTLNENKSYLEFKIKNKDKINQALEKYFDNRGLLGDYFYMIYHCSEDTIERYKKFYIENTLEKYKKEFLSDI